MSERHGERRVHPVDEPAPTLTEKARSDEWEYATRNGGYGTDFSRGAQPAPTLTAAGLSQGRDVIRRRYVNGNQPNAAVRDEDEPAPTLHFGAAMNDVKWTEGRPATTVAGDPRVAEPGHKRDEANPDSPGRMENAVRVTETEAAILQGFPPDYPWDGLAVPAHIPTSFNVEADHAVTDEFISDLRERGVGFAVRLRRGENDQVLQAVVVPDSVDVVDDLTRLRPGDLAMLRGHALAGDEDVASAIALGSSSETLGTVLVRVERITVEPPLLPVSGAPAASDRFAFTVLADLLGCATHDPEPSVADALVVHETHPLGPVRSVATFDLADAHISSVSFRSAGNSRTKQFQQVGNAVPPPLAYAILAALICEEP